MENQETLMWGLLAALNQGLNVFFDEKKI